MDVACWWHKAIDAMTERKGINGGDQIVSAIRKGVLFTNLPPPPPKKEGFLGGTQHPLDIGKGIKEKIAE